MTASAALPARPPARLVLAIGVAYSVLAALVSYAFTRLTGLSLWTLRPDASVDFTYILLMNTLLWGSWALFAPIVFELGTRFRFDRSGWRRALLVHLPAAAVVTTTHIVLAASARFLLQTAWGVPTDWGGNVRDAFFRTLDFELPVYWALVGLQHALDYYREVRTRDVAAAHLEMRLVEAQLQALQRQLQPHFLFNTLHAISALVHKQPDVAEAMIERLSDLLRITLDKVGIQEVTLAEELDYLRAYLDIEQMHFGHRLAIEYRVEPATFAARVPNLILQPLAENAIRHGLEPRAGRARLTIQASLEGKRLRLAVIDNGPGMPAAAADGTLAGVGLSNTRTRLERLYGGRAHLRFAVSDGGGATVIVELPFSEAGINAHAHAGRGGSAAGTRTLAGAARG